MHGTRQEGCSIQGFSLLKTVVKLTNNFWMTTFRTSSVASPQGLINSNFWAVWVLVNVLI